MEFFDLFGNVLAEPVQYYNPGSIERVCESINYPANSDGFAGLAAYFRYIMSEGGYCLAFKYEDTIRDLQNTEYIDGKELRQWIYQTCNEFGYFQSSGSPNQPFGKSFPVELSIQICADVYDKSFTKENIEENVRQTNLKHYGLDPKVSNVVFTQGDLDPWYPLGINQNYSDTAPAFVISNYSNCADLKPSVEDTEEMKHAKQIIWNLIDVFK